EISFKLQELAHEVQVGRDDRSSQLHKLVGVHHGHPGVFHQVRDDDSGRARDARLAVNEQSFTCLV
ncbi:hypothetical protein C0J50_13633, partial [Silurus asotus]